MSPSNAALARSIDSHLTKEISVHERYIDTLKDHKSFITKFKLKKLEDLDRRRLTLAAEMRILHEKRLRLSGSFPESGSKRLSALVSQHLGEKEKSLLLPKIEYLRQLVIQERELSTEASILVQFAQNLVNGSLSLLYQATQSVTRAYGRKGKVQERTNPKNSRRETLLKQA